MRTYWIKHLRIAAFLVLAIQLAACGSYPVNPRLDAYNSEQGYRFDQLDQDGKPDKLFVIVTFSPILSSTTERSIAAR